MTAFSDTSDSALNTLIIVGEPWQKKMVLKCLMFSLGHSFYTISDLTPQSKIFPTIYNIPYPISLYFFTTKQFKDVD